MTKKHHTFYFSWPQYGKIFSENHPHTRFDNEAAPPSHNSKKCHFTLGKHDVYDA
jgi:hypothetical protein